MGAVSGLLREVLARFRLRRWASRADPLVDRGIYMALDIKERHEVDETSVEAHWAEGGSLRVLDKYDVR